MSKSSQLMNEKSNLLNKEFKTSNFIDQKSFDSNEDIIIKSQENNEKNDPDVKKKAKKIVLIVLIGGFFVFCIQILFLWKKKKWQGEFPKVFLSQPFNQISQYIYLKMPNGMQSILQIQNLKTNRIYFSLSFEPNYNKNRFLQQIINNLMLFGSSQYPDDDFLFNFLEKRDGKVKSDFINGNFVLYGYINEDSIDQFFKILIDKIQNPLFSIKQILNEIKKKNKQIKLSIKDQNYQVIDILQKIGTKDSTLMKQFNIQNDDDHVKERIEIIDIYKDFINSDSMTISISSNKNIKNTIQHYFEFFKRKQVKNKQEYINTLNDDNKSSIYFGVSDISQFNMIFEIDSLVNPLQNSIFLIFKQFFESKSQNSLQDQLIKLNIIKSLRIKIITQNNLKCIISLQFDLQDKNRSQISILVEFFYYFLNFLKRNPKIMQENIDNFINIFNYDYFFNILNGKNDFSIQNNSILQQVINLSINLKKYQQQNWFSIKNIIKSIDMKQFTEFINKLQLRNSVLIRTINDKKNKTQVLSEIPQQDSSFKDMMYKFIQKQQKFQQNLNENLIYFSLTEIKEAKQEAQKLTQNVLKQTFYLKFLDISVNKQKLSKEFIKKQIPVFMFDMLNQFTKQNSKSFTLVKQFTTDPFLTFHIFSKCSMPKEIKFNQNKIIEIKNKEIRKQIALLLKQNEEKVSLIDTQKYSQIMNETQDKFNYIKEKIYQYKLCLFEDFQKDKQLLFNNVYQKDNFRIKNKIYRRTLQPISIIYFVFSDFKVFNYSELLLFCRYNNIYFQQFYQQDIYFGSTFKCYIYDNQLIIKIKFLTYLVQQILLKTTEELKNINQNMDQKIIDKCIEELENQKQTNNNKLNDLLYDNDNKYNQNAVLQTILNLQQTDLQLIFIGQMRSKNVLKIGLKIKKIINLQQKTKQKIQKFSLFEKDHYLIRKINEEDQNYLSCFQLKRIDYLQNNYLKIIGILFKKILKKQKLQNIEIEINLNLKLFCFQIDNFDIQDEEIIEQSIHKLKDQIKFIDLNQIDQLFQSIQSDLIQQDNDISVISDQFVDFIIHNDQFDKFDQIQSKELFQFFVENFVNQFRRITFESFSKQLSSSVEKFVLNKEKMFNQIEYRVTDLEQVKIVLQKNKNNQI